MPLWLPHTERNALASLGRCPPSQSTGTPFSSAALCRTRLEHGGKVPRVVIGKCDEWLRKSAAKDERALVALSEPPESEMKKIDRLLKRG